MVHTLIKPDVMSVANVSALLIDDTDFVFRRLSPGSLMAIDREDETGSQIFAVLNKTRHVHIYGTHFHSLFRLSLEGKLRPKLLAQNTMLLG